MADDRGISGGFADAATEQQFHEHLGLADRLARKYSFGRGADDDLRQVARLGLLLACRRFDPELGSFPRFASVTVIGELKKHLRSHGWGVRVPRALQEDSITVAAAIDRLTARMGRAPTTVEVAEHTGFDLERVAEAIRARDARFSGSIEHERLDIGSAANPIDEALLSVALSRLSAEQRQLIGYRLDDGLTQAEIGKLVGISQPQVHRRLTKAMEALRVELEVD